MTALIVGGDYVEPLKREIRVHGHELDVDAIHRFGAILLVRDIETEEEMSAAVRAGADMLQGRFLGEPTRAIEPISRRAQAQGSHPGYAW